VDIILDDDLEPELEVPEGRDDQKQHRHRASGVASHSVTAAIIERGQRSSDTISQMKSRKVAIEVSRSSRQ
jgi:hypothetical protein